MSTRPPVDRDPGEPLNSMRLSQMFHEFIAEFPQLQREALAYLYGVVTQHPTHGGLPTLWEIVNVDVMPDGGTLVLDLSDGTTIRLDVSRYDTEKESD
jgi:hypothetical protein